MISDQALMQAVSPTNTTGRGYAAIFMDGTDLIFRAATRDEAQRLASEYGHRFLGGTRLTMLYWLR